MNVNLESEIGDFSPNLRTYQCAILNKAQCENTIVYLPPGTGKTFVAAILMKLMSRETQKKFLEGGKRTFFLLDSNVLSEQRKESIRTYSSLSVGPSAEDEASLKTMDESVWRSNFEQYQVLVIKIKRFTEILKNNYISLKNINLLVLDECHSATQRVAMIKVMKAYEGSPRGERPRLLGLTATLLEADVAAHRIARAVAKLERKLQSSVATIGNSTEIQRYMSSPIEKHLPYDEPVQFKFLDEIKTGIKYISEFVIGYGCDEDVRKLPFFEESIFYKEIELSRKLVRHLVDVWHNIEKLGIYGGSIATVKLMMYMQRLGAKTTSRDSAMVYLTFIKLLVSIRDTLLKKMEGACEIAKIYEYSSCQVTTLLDILKEFKLGNNRCIIFVERRSTSEVIYNILKAASDNIENMSYIRADYIVGVGSEPVTNDRRKFLNEGNMEVFERFKTGEINVLVTTDIVNEGFDTPDCKLVIRFDIPKTYRAYVLSKAWATLKNSYYVFLSPKKDKREVWKTMIDYRSKEDIFHQILIGQASKISEVPTS